MSDTNRAMPDDGYDALFVDRERPRSPAEALEPARAPERPRRAGRFRPHPIFRLLNGFLTLLLLAMIAAGGLLYFAKYQFDRPGPLAAAKVIVIPKGEGVTAIAARLENEGIISDRRLFVASVMYFDAQDKLKAGEYEFPKQASMRQVLDALVQGRAILHRFTIPEGYTSRQVVDALMQHEALSGTVAEIPPEGSLLPDTYRFSRGTSRQEIIERMQAEQRSFMAKMWEKRADDLPFKTPQEAIVLASIVEKETGRADERPRIAAVFINRLKKNMRLQSDPTIIYGLTGGEGPLGRPLLRSEIDRETPYNTYQINGLPPTPIANPGRAAIEAVLRPAKTDELYFVADGTGGHAFARTLEEHNANVARWRQIERERNAREAQAKADSAANGGTDGGTDGATEGTPASGAVAELPLQGLVVGQDADAPTVAGIPLPVRKPRSR